MDADILRFQAQVASSRAARPGVRAAPFTDKFGGTDSPLKPIAASGGLGAIILLVTLVFLPLDLQSITAAPAALRGLLGLHVYGRDIYLFTLAFSAYAWHLRWLADH